MLPTHNAVLLNPVLFWEGDSVVCVVDALWLSMVCVCLASKMHKQADVADRTLQIMYSFLALQAGFAPRSSSHPAMAASKHCHRKGTA
jgi:hypothetical protein